MTLIVPPRIPRGSKMFAVTVGAEIPNRTLTWIDEATGLPYQFGTDLHTFELRINTYDAIIIKNTGITGNNGDPNVLFTFVPGELDGIAPGHYHAQLWAHRLADNKDLEPIDFRFVVSVGLLAGSPLVLSGGADNPNIVIPPNWSDGSWAAALLDADTRPVTVAIIGDSIGVGQYSNNWLTDGWHNVVRTSLQATFGAGGSGFIHHTYRLLDFGGGQVTGVGDWTDVTTEGGVTRSAARPLNPGNGATLSFPVTGAAIDLFFKTDPSFGTFDYRIDGGAWTPVALNIAPQILKVTAAVAAGAHVVDVRATTGQGRVFGVAGRNPTGVRVDNFSVGGTHTVHMSVQVSGTGTTDPYDNTVAKRTLEQLGPYDLIIVCLGAGDVVLDVDDPTFLTNVWNGLASLHYAAGRHGQVLGTPPAMVQIAEHVGAGDTVPPFVLFERDWLQMHATLRDFASSIGAVFVDVWGDGRRSWEYWNGLGFWGGALGNDTIHPSTLGHQRYGELVLDAINAG